MDVALAHIDARTACAAARHPTDDHHDAILRFSESLRLERLNSELLVVLIPHRPAAVEPAICLSPRPARVLSIFELGVGPSTHLQPCLLELRLVALRLGPVIAIEELVGSPHDLDVALRHRLRSISSSCASMQGDGRRKAFAQVRERPTMSLVRRALTAGSAVAIHRPPRASATWAS